MKIARRSLESLGHDVMDEPALGALGRIDREVPAFAHADLDATMSEVRWTDGRVASVILETVALVQLLRETPGAEVLSGLEAADTLCVSAASLFEINQTVRIGKLDVPSFDRSRIEILRARGPEIMPVDVAVMAHAATLVWIHAERDHRNPFDRMVAATALALGIPVATSDAAFADLAGTGLVVRFI